MHLHEVQEVCVIHTIGQLHCPGRIVMMEEYKSLFGSVMANLGSRPDSAMNDFKTLTMGQQLVEYRGSICFATYAFHKLDWGRLLRHVDCVLEYGGW